MGSNLFFTMYACTGEYKELLQQRQLGNAYREWKVLGIWINPAFFLHRHNIHHYNCNSFPSGTGVTGDTILTTPVSIEYLAHLPKRNSFLPYPDVLWGHRVHSFVDNNFYDTYFWAFDPKPFPSFCLSWCGRENWA